MVICFVLPLYTARAVFNIGQGVRACFSSGYTSVAKIVPAAAVTPEQIFITHVSVIFIAS